MSNFDTIISLSSFFNLTIARQGHSSCSVSVNHSVLVDLADIVHQGKQPPLDIHLGFGAQGEVVQTLLDTDIGKDRLNNGQASGIDLFALWCVDLGFHLVDQIGSLIIHPDGQVPE